MVHHLLLKSGAETLKYRRPKPQIERRPDEWTIVELAEQIGMPQTTLYAWVQKGRLCCRRVNDAPNGVMLICADAETIVALKAIRNTPPPWRRLPQRLGDAATPDS